MQTYSTIYGQSFSDAVCNTYGTMDKYVQMLNENGISPDDIPSTAQQLTWDNTQVVDQSALSLLSQKNIKFATLFGTGAETSPDPINPTTMYYKDPRNAQYTATTDGETVVTITALQGNEVVSVTKELKQLLPSDYIFDDVAGTITLTGGLSLMTGETIFVLYKKTITA